MTMVMVVMVLMTVIMMVMIDGDRNSNDCGDGYGGIDDGDIDYNGGDGSNIIN